MKPFLVEIRVKDWIATDKPIVSFEEVMAYDEIHARHEGYDQFCRRIQFEPVAKRKWLSRGLGIKDICAPDAVEIDI